MHVTNVDLDFDHQQEQRRICDTPCPSGSYCPPGTTHGLEFLCPAGSFYNVTGAKDVTDCLPCTPGSYCEIDGLSAPTGLCAPGMEASLP